MINIVFRIIPRVSGVVNKLLSITKIQNTVLFNCFYCACGQKLAGSTALPKAKLHQVVARTNAT